MTGMRVSSFPTGINPGIFRATRGIREVSTIQFRLAHVASVFVILYECPVQAEWQIYKVLCSWINIAINLMFGQEPENIRHYHVVLFPAYQ